MSCLLTLHCTTQVAFIARNPKVARAARQKVLNRQVVEELGKAAKQTALPGAEAVAKLAASPELRAACVAAARAAELDLYKRCNSTAVRGSAWEPCAADARPQLGPDISMAIATTS